MTQDDWTGLAVIGIVSTPMVLGFIALGILEHRFRHPRR